MRIIRRAFLSSTAAAWAFAAVPRAQAHSGCIFGAIRWDAQYCNTPGQPCYEEEQILGPAKWQFRAPLHTQVLGPNKIRFEPTQATFDAEIRAARGGGLSYWAYLMYGDPHTGVIDLSHSMMKGLAFHRASSIKAQMKYAMMVTTGTLGSKGRFGPAVSAVLSLMHDSNYQTCLNGRPVLYLYYSEADLKGWWGGTYAHLKASLDAVRAGALSGGLGDPYVIVMTPPPAKAEAVRVALGADAISIYAGPVPQTDNATYAQLDQMTQAYWVSEVAATSAGVVPTVMIGWDTRPRRQHPPSWEHRTVPLHPDMSHYVSAPTPKQFAGECRAAVNFIDANLKACASRLGLIYAWDEDSEGGPLEPTLGDHAARKLMSISNVL